MRTEYRIESLWDFLAVPPDRIDDCLEEFATALEAIRSSLTILKELTPPDRRDAVRWAPGAFTWIDDGKRNETLTLSHTTPEAP